MDDDALDGVRVGVVVGGRVEGLASREAEREWARSTWEGLARAEWAAALDRSSALLLLRAELLWARRVGDRLLPLLPPEWTTARVARRASRGESMRRRSMTMTSATVARRWLTPAEACGSVGSKVSKSVKLLREERLEKATSLASLVSM